MSAKRARKPGRPVSPDCRHRQVADDLRARMAGGDLRAGRPLPALRRLARKYRVGQHTVRMAVELLKREGRVRSGPGRRLIVCATGSRRGPLEGTVVLVASSPLDRMTRSPYMGELLRGVHVGVGEARAPLLVVPGGEFFRKPPEEVFSLPVRGLLLVGVFTDAVLARYEKLALPVVLLDQPSPRHRLHTVTVDNLPAAREATEKLIELGHRRMAFVRTLQLDARRVDPDSRERQEGFLQAVEAAGIRARDCEIINSLPGDTPKSPALRSLVRARRPFTAVVTATGGLAEKVAAAARAVGRKIPEDLSVVCLQGREAGFTRFSGPRMNFEEVGRRAVALLDAPRHPPQHLRVPAEWADAESTAAPGV
ncbi:MAG: substrate-binding domain-containing protein [Planctomycetota bacterium]